MRTWAAGTLGAVRARSIGRAREWDGTTQRTRRRRASGSRSTRDPCAPCSNATASTSSVTRPSTSQLARVLTDEQSRHRRARRHDRHRRGGGRDARSCPTRGSSSMWPAAVMPIAGAVRVEPSEVATTLTATVALAAGLSGLGAIDRPEWIERVKKDPATLREMLAARGRSPLGRASRNCSGEGHRLHPSPAASKRAARSADAAAAVVPIGCGRRQARGRRGCGGCRDRSARPGVPVEPQARRGLARQRRCGGRRDDRARARRRARAEHRVGRAVPPRVASHGGGPASGTGGETPNPGGNGGTSAIGGGRGGRRSSGGGPDGNIQGLGGGPHRKRLVG